MAGNGRSGVECPVLASRRVRPSGEVHLARTPVRHCSSSRTRSTYCTSPAVFGTGPGSGVDRVNPPVRHGPGWGSSFPSHPVRLAAPSRTGGAFSSS